MNPRPRPLESPQLAVLAQRQSAVVRRSQLADIGINRHHIRSQVEAQRWRLVGSMVVVLHRGDLTAAQRRWVGALHAGPRSLVAGLTALDVHGLRGWDRDEVHVVVPPGLHVPPLAGVLAHMSRHLDPRDIASGSALPVTTVARSALDAARWQSSSRRARGVILSVVQQRLVRPVQLAECLGRLGRVTHAASIASAILDSSGGADSLAEVEVADLVVRAGLPRPRRQVLVETLDGPRRVDIVVDLPDGRLLVIEVDGIHHLSTDVRLADAAKDAAIIAAGHQVLRIPVEALRRDSAALLSQLIAIRESAQRRARMSHKAR